MKKNITFGIVLLCFSSLFSNISFANNNQATELINATLNNFHLAAAQANLVNYFAQLTDNAVFLGTDASERWSKAEFKDYVAPMFSKGHGWRYKSIERHISLSKNSNTAFFDELLNNENYGLCRGSGILYKTAQGWKIAQYNLSVPLPNAIAKNLIEQIKSHQLLSSQQKNDPHKLVKTKAHKTLAKKKNGE